MKRLSGDMRVYIGLAVFVIVCVVLFGAGGRDGDSGQELIPRRTTYSTSRGGVKALYETLEQVGYPVRRQLTSFTSAPPDGVMFMISPEEAPSQTEWQAIRRWVEQGNMLIVAGQSLTSSNPFRRDELNPSHSKPACPSFLSPGVTDFCLDETTRLTDSELGLVGLNGLVKPFG